jgi:hypothetical protein
VRAEEVTAARSHDNPELCEFGIVAEKGSRPGAEKGEKQCRRAYGLAVLKRSGKMFLFVTASPNRPPLHNVRNDCIGTLSAFE